MVLFTTSLRKNRTMLEYKLVRLPSEASLAVWENFINSFAVQGWKLVQLEQGTVGSGPGYIILERMKSSEDRYRQVIDSGPPEHAAARFTKFIEDHALAARKEAVDDGPPKSKSNPIGGRAVAALDTNI